MEYKLDNGACVPVRVHTIVISVHHKEGIDLQTMQDELKEKVIQVSLGIHFLTSDLKKDFFTLSLWWTPSIWMKKPCTIFSHLENTSLEDPWYRLWAYWQNSYLCCLGLFSLQIFSNIYKLKAWDFKVF